MGHSTSLKNTLQKEAQQYLKTLDRNVIFAEDLEEAKAIILEELKAINEKNKRCKPQNFGWWERDNTVQLCGFYEVAFSLRAGEHKHITALKSRTI